MIMIEWQIISNKITVVKRSAVCGGVGIWW